MASFLSISPSSGLSCSIAVNVDACETSTLNKCFFSSFFPGGGLDPGVVPGGGWLGQEELVSGGSRAHADGLCHARHPLQTCGAKEDQQE